MANSTSSTAFRGTAEQKEKLDELIAAHQDMRGALMPVLQQAQDIYGYLPVEVQRMIAAGLGVPVEEVYGVATFYGQFSLTPKGENRVCICLGTACYVKGAGTVLERLEDKLGIKSGGVTEDGRFSLDATRCLGACGLAPIVTVNEEIYGRLLPAEVDDILAKYQ